jgi:sorbitol-6-phosphate 2-dehydrogenase/meso-butanediol dehydrogenase/(S,S)-butanediol dehydrogenase/diacetyl reductase
MPEPRRALVTGGASGFGAAIARQLVEDGARVALVDVSEAALATTVAALGPVASAHACDVRDKAAVLATVDAAVARMGGLDTLVVSAGVIQVGALAEVSEADWDRTLGINLKGAFLVIQAAAPHLVASGRGRILAISSDAGRRGFPGIAAYCASKFGLIGLVESVAVELAPHGVTVNALCPVGAPSTGMGQQVLAWKMRATGRPAEEILAAAAATNPLGRNATEADVVAAARFLVSEEASFLTGVSLDVDGGAHLGFLPGT